MRKVIGLTGGIATGKSTVTHYLVTHGYEVIDADLVSHEALEKESACFQQVVDHFDCMDHQGLIDRRKLGTIVFSDEKERAYLESILHPYIMSCIKEKIEKSHEELIFLDVPLLFEAHFDTLCDMSVVVSCDDQTQLSRLMQRDHLTKEEALARIHAQMSLKEKRKKADLIIDNSKDLCFLEQEIRKMLKEVAA